ncbi:hypothetical protein K2F43_05820 [Clostridium estertheticum]|uniref:hypothetical protein n=1 Tax=Clostridium estertheticum TaxID=238834 RepID=UPI001C6E2D81|nr:hypothetical protein [Clostridium estertheticum]MBW9170722.1 hypothetical protein [Clostridium estertheticum]WLC74437.1 hypothetical protein KTC99_16930 [Clostridium estertheticum]
MYKNRQSEWMLVILMMIMAILSFEFIISKNKFITYNDNKVVSSITAKNMKSTQKFGYSDILECLSKNKDFKVESINMMDNEKCNVEVKYKGDLNLLYSSLVKLTESKNLLNVSKIIIHKDSEITNIEIDFKKNK